MSTGDITLPNQSGVIDPRIRREAELQAQREFLRRSQAPPPAPKREALINVLKRTFSQ